MTTISERERDYAKQTLEDSGELPMIRTTYRVKHTQKEGHHPGDLTVEVTRPAGAPLPDDMARGLLVQAYRECLEACQNIQGASGPSEVPF